MNDFPGFKALYSHPDLFAEMAKSREALEKAIAAAASWNDDEVDHAVRHFVLEVKSSSEAAILKSLDVKVHAPLEKLLADAGLHKRLVTPSGIRYGLPESPLDRACELLKDAPPSRFVVILQPFLTEPSNDIRRSIGRVLGAVGTKESLTALRKAMNDSDRFVVSGTLLGTFTAWRDKRLSPEMQTELFPDFVALLDRTDVCDDAADMMLRFDAGRAGKILVAEPYLSPEYSRLLGMLLVLRKHDVLVLRERSLAIIRSFEPKPLGEFPNGAVLTYALEMLAQHREPDDRALLERFTEHAENDVAEGALTALLIWGGLGDFEQRIDKLIGDGGEAARTSPLRHFDPVMVLDGEVGNGGFSQYFFNSGGDNWREALAGLDALELTEQAKLFRAAIAKFGPTPPSTDRAERAKQLSMLENAEDSPFGELQDRYFKLKPSVRSVVLRYILKHRDALK